MRGAAPSRSALFAFSSVSFAYFSYAGLFGTYAPLWFQSLGFGTLAIGALASMQSATRLFSPYAWGWLADHTGHRTRLLRIAVGGALVCAVCFFIPGPYGWLAAVTVALFVCTAGVVPINEAALAHLVSRGTKLDAGRYGRVRVWGSIGFIVAVVGSGALLEAWGVRGFPWLVVALLLLLMTAALRLPDSIEAAHAAGASPGALTVLAHTSLYAFFSLYLVSLGYNKAAVGLIWAIGVAVEVLWFWFQGRWIGRLTPHAWLLLAALIAAVRFALVAEFGALTWLLVLTQCSHAFTFAAQHSSCIAIINRHFPGRLRGRGQALYSVLGYGASGVVGGLLGGALSEAFGFGAVFWGGCIAALAGALCCARAWVLERRGEAAWAMTSAL
jgi:PPP family 3-phenylpropionic acid transporter